MYLSKNIEKPKLMSSIMSGYKGNLYRAERIIEKYPNVYFVNPLGST